MMQRIVINTCFGGFSLSDVALDLYKAYAGIDRDESWHDWALERDDPILLQVIDQLGVRECSGHLADLKVVEVPDGVVWEIDEYDGREHVAECHRIWS
jgi:hypothetical protein